jgi:hypothetical protein
MKWGWVVEQRRVRKVYKLKVALAKANGKYEAYKATTGPTYTDYQKERMVELRGIRDALQMQVELMTGEILL